MRVERIIARTIANKKFKLTKVEEQRLTSRGLLQAAQRQAHMNGWHEGMEDALGAITEAAKDLAYDVEVGGLC